MHNKFQICITYYNSLNMCVFIVNILFMGLPGYCSNISVVPKILNSRETTVRVIDKLK